MSIWLQKLIVFLITTGVGYYLLTDSGPWGQIIVFGAILAEFSFKPITKDIWVWYRAKCVENRFWALVLVAFIVLGGCFYDAFLGLYVGLVKPFLDESLGMRILFSVMFSAVPVSMTRKEE